ncbi:MAG: AAA family ATPase [Promethearchaeota archaeon]
MIHKIVLENFLTYKYTELNLKPLMVLIGKNETGKSNIFRALLLVKQILLVNKLKDKNRSQNDNKGNSSVKYIIPFQTEADIERILLKTKNYKSTFAKITIRGNFIGSFIRGLKSDDIQYKIELKINKYGYTLQTQLSRMFKQIELKFISEINVPLNSLSYHINRSELIYINQKNNEKKIEDLKKFIGNIDGFKIFFKELKSIEKKEVLGAINEFIIDTRIKDLEENDRLLFFALECFGEFKKYFAAAHYIIRKFEPFEEYYNLLDNPIDIEAEDFKMLEFLTIEEILSTLKYWEEDQNREGIEYIKMIDSMFLNLFPREKYKLRITLARGKKLFPNIDSEGGTTDLHFISGGLHNILEIILKIIVTPNNGIILIDEPEIHTEVGNHFLLLKSLYLLCKKKHQQLIIATHSEHLLFGLTLLLSEKLIERKDCSLINFKLEDFITKINNVNINEDNIIESLEHFGECTRKELDIISNVLESKSSTKENDVKKQATN